MKKIAFILLAVVFSAFASAQTVDLSGNWNLNVAKSTLNDQFSLAPKALNINQNNNELTVEKKMDFQGQDMSLTENFKLDGSECTNPGIMESVKKSKVVISDDKKSITITSQVDAPNIGAISITEVYSIDNDSLTYQSTSSSSSFGEMSETAVYSKN